MLFQVDDALLHAMSGIELSRVRTELRLLLPEAYQQKSDRVERGTTYQDLAACSGGSFQVADASPRI